MKYIEQSWLERILQNEKDVAYMISRHFKDITLVDKYCESRALGAKTLELQLESAPKIDIVRCDECIHYDVICCKRNETPMFVSAKDFCSRGERR